MATRKTATAAPSKGPATTRGKKTEVKAPENNALAAFDFAEDAGLGAETADKESVAIPFLNVLQKSSPQVDEADGDFIEGARPGQFYNTVTGELYDGKDGVIFVPCAFQRRFIKWGPRGTPDGGFKGEFLPEDVAELKARGRLVDQDNRLFEPLEDGTVDDKRCNYFADTRNHFGLLVDDATGEFQEVLLSLGSTQIKKSKQLVTLLHGVKVDGPQGKKVTPPTWVNRIRLTTVPESNDKGTWFGVRVGRDDAAKFIDRQDLYEAGKRFYELIAAGEGKVNYDAGASTESAAEEQPEGQF